MGHGHFQLFFYNDYYLRNCAEVIRMIEEALAKHPLPKKEKKPLLPTCDYKDLFLY